MTAALPLHLHSARMRRRWRAGYRPFGRLGYTLVRVTRLDPDTGQLTGETWAGRARLGPRRLGFRTPRPRRSYPFEERQ